MRLVTSSRSARCAAAIISSAWATVMASGFSHITCLPAASAASACGWCRNGGSRDVDEIDVVAPEERVDGFDVRDAEPPGRGLGRRAVRAGHRHQAHARDLSELLEGVEAEATGTDNAETDRVLAHEDSSGSV